ncbi:MAG: Lsr2 family protein [Actinobacteria bacterium]|nr:Lsr2 family protein [Actinomycetota bacterium]MBW3651457.1 Lsr2 family protein [Actinomycetota bacterium]
MAREQHVVETIICDICGKTAEEATTVVIGWGKEQWEIDLCQVDNAKVSRTFDGWIAGGRKVRATRGSTKSAKGAKGASRGNGSDWDYLESLGFARHRGRKTAAEQEALASREA